MNTEEPPAAKRVSFWLWFICGVVAGGIGVLGAGEIYVRFFPPEDLYPYLGEDSPLTGIYKTDAVLGADYVSYEAFRGHYAERLAALGALDSPRPTWLWLGNSFVQAPGMLGDTAQAALPGTRMFYLQRNEMPYLRLAQARLLLAQGLRPERVIFVLIPADCVGILQQPLGAICVTSRGAITLRAQSAGIWDGLIGRSRLALLTWVRHGGRWGAAAGRVPAVTEEVPPRVERDLRVLVDVLAGLAKEHGTTATVVVIPNREEIMGLGQYAFQDAIVGMCRDEGIDCFDARGIFGGDGDKLTLFLPDWHFTPRANRMLLAGLLAHFDAVKAGTRQARP